MDTIKFYKEISKVELPYEPNSFYAVRTGEGFDLQLSDSTGGVLHTLNSKPLSVVGGRNLIYDADVTVDSGSEKVFEIYLPASLKRQKEFTLSFHLHVDEPIQIDSEKQDPFKAELSVTANYEDGSTETFKTFKDFSEKSESFSGIVYEVIKIPDDKVLTSFTDCKLIVGSLAGGKSFEVGYPKLEIGSIVTDWSQAPEDLLYNLRVGSKNYYNTLTGTVEVSSGVLTGPGVGSANVSFERGLVTLSTLTNNSTVFTFKGFSVASAGKYLLSFTGSSSVETDIMFTLSDDTPTQITLTPTPTFYQIPFEIGESVWDEGLSLTAEVNQKVNISLIGFMLEKGSVPSDYSINPEFLMQPLQETFEQASKLPSFEYSLADFSRRFDQHSNDFQKYTSEVDEELRDIKTKLGGSSVDLTPVTTEIEELKEMYLRKVATTTQTTVTSFPVIADVSPMSYFGYYYTFYIKYTHTDKNFSGSLKAFIVHHYRDGSIDSRESSVHFVNGTATTKVRFQYRTDSREVLKTTVRLETSTREEQLAFFSYTYESQPVIIPQSDQWTLEEAVSKRLAKTLRAKNDREGYDLLYKSDYELGTLYVSPESSVTLTVTPADLYSNHSHSYLKPVSIDINKIISFEGETPSFKEVDYLELLDIILKANDNDPIKAFGMIKENQGIYYYIPLTANTIDMYKEHYGFTDEDLNLVGYTEQFTYENYNQYQYDLLELGPDKVLNIRGLDLNHLVNNTVTLRYTEGITYFNSNVLPKNLTESY